KLISGIVFFWRLRIPRLQSFDGFREDLRIGRYRRNDFASQHLGKRSITDEGTVTTRPLWWETLPVESRSQSRCVKQKRAVFKPFLFQCHARAYKENVGRDLIWRFQDGFESFGLVGTFEQFLKKLLLSAGLRESYRGKKDEAAKGDDVGLHNQN